MPVQVQGPDGQTYQFPDGTDKAGAVAYFKKKGIGAKADAPPANAAPAPGPLDRLASSVANKLPNLTPEDEHKEAQGYGGTFFGEGGDRFITNTARTTARDLAAIPAGVVDYFVKNGVKGPWTPKQSAQRMAENAKGGTPAPKSPPGVTGADVSDYASEQAGGLAAGAIAGEATAGLFRGGKGLARRTADAVAGTGPRVAKTLAKEDTAAANTADALKTAEDNHAAALKHLEETQKALHETEGKELTHTQTLKATQEEAAAKRKVQLTKHLAETAKAKAQRQAAQEEFDSARTAQRKIEPQEKKLSNARGALRAATETAREKALKVGNEKFNAVNEQLNPLPADMEKVHGLYFEAAESFGEPQAQPALINRLGKALQNNAELTYKDEQALYSELGKELSKGTLPGTTYHAYDLLHEGLGADMQRIADSKGQGAELTDARAYWRRMKQTFGKPITFNDAANKAIGGVKDEAQENAVRLLGSFDPEIPKLYSHTQNIEKGVDFLPKPVPERELTRKLAESRPSLPKLPNAPQPEALKPVERVAPPNRPNDMLPAPKKIGSEDVQAAKAKGLGKRADLVQHKALWIAAGPPIYALVDMLRGHLPNMGEVAAVSAGVGAVIAGVGRLLENPKVVDFLTKATTRDVEAIPPELRGDFPAVVKAAQSKGLKVSPALLGIVATSGMLAPRKPEQNPTDAWAGVQQ